MGWWPFSSGGSDGSTQSSVGLTDEQRMRIFGRPNPIASSSKGAQEKPDAELDAFIKSFSASDASHSEATPSQLPSLTTHQEPSPPKPTTPSRLLPNGTLDISPHHLHPRTMSCRQQFDQAFYCQSLGGKFNDIYRYGHIKSCSEQWGAFWFCMRTRNLPEGEREEAIREFYEKREEERGRRSEDVWEVRRVSVRRAFGRDPDEEGEGEGMVRE